MSPRRHAPLLVLLLAACAGPVERTQPPPGEAANAACGPPESVRRAVLAQVNAARTARRVCGTRSMAAAAPVDWSPALARAAAAHARDMAANDFVAHAGSDGARVDTRATRAGYAWRAIGENIGAGPRDAGRAVAHWLDSPGHCRNLMNPDYTEIGAACMRAPGSRYETYWTLVFGEPR